MTPSEDRRKLRIYVATSWRNEYQPRLVLALRADGHEVYDFRNPAPGNNGFAWSSIDPEWKQWTPEVYRGALRHPLAEAGFKSDMDALRWADVCVMVMPCGPSASMEMGWACGAGRKVAVYIPATREPDLMVKMADFITTDEEALREWLLEIGCSDRRTAPASGTTGDADLDRDLQTLYEMRHPAPVPPDTPRSCSNSGPGPIRAPQVAPAAPRSQEGIPACEVIEPFDAAPPQTLLEWMRERHANCLRLAAQKSGEDKFGWLEDAEYFRQAIERLDTLPPVPPLSGHVPGNPRPWPKIWSVQSDHTNIAYFNEDAAKRYLAERKEPHKFHIVEYIPAAPPSPPSEGREQWLERALRAADDELCRVAFRHEDYAIPHELRRTINDALAGIVTGEAKKQNMKGASVPAAPEEKPAETPKDNAETEKE